MRNEKGFTLIELVMVIVLLGVLAAVAIPKFIDIGDEAKDAALNGVVGGMGSAMSINYGARSVSATKGSAVANCTDVSSLLAGGVPSGYAVTAQVIAPGATVACTVTPSDPGTLATLTFQGIGIL